MKKIFKAPETVKMQGFFSSAGIAIDPLLNTVSLLG
jgi:hypothetical protein